MFRIRATQKLLNISKIKPETETATPPNSYIDQNKEWYANLISSTFQGKMFVIYVHVPTKLMLLVPGKSLTSTLPRFYERLEQFLLRNGIPHYDAEKLISKADKPLILKTDSKRFLGCLNEYKATLEFKFYSVAEYEDLELNEIEDIEYEHSFWVKDKEKKKALETPKELLQEFLRS